MFFYVIYVTDFIIDLFYVDTKSLKSTSHWSINNLSTK